MATPYKLESSSNSAFQCLLEIQFSVFLGNTEASVTDFLHFHRGPSSRCCLGLGKWRCFQSGFVLEKHNEDRKPDYRSWLRLAPAYLHALAFAPLSLEALGCLASSPLPMVVHVSGWTFDTHLFQNLTRLIWYSAYHFFQRNSSSWDLLLASVGRLSFLVD